MITLHDVRPDVFHLLLHFMYTGEIPDTFKRMTKDLLVTANLYDLPGVVNLCAQELADGIEMENCLELAEFADLYNQATLKTAAFNFLRDNFKQIAKRDDWTIAFWARSLDKTEQYYSVVNKEALAMFAERCVVIVEAVLA